LKEKPEGVSHVDTSLKKVFEAIKMHPELKYISDHFVTPLEKGEDT
jgi:hypothetical protein